MREYHIPTEVSEAIVGVESDDYIEDEELVEEIVKLYERVDGSDDEDE